MNSMWTVLGFVGQAVFGGRFLVQWLASERAGRSIIPRQFWHMSLLGSTILLVYSIYKHDAVFILGQSAGLAIYLRNLLLIRRADARGDVVRAGA